MRIIRVQQALIFAQFYLHSAIYMMHKAQNFKCLVLNLILSVTYTVLTVR